MTDMPIFIMINRASLSNSCHRCYVVGRYGDTAPITVPGRCLGFLWMMFGLLIFTVFNGVITSAITAASVTKMVMLPQHIDSVNTLYTSRNLFPICTPNAYHKDFLLGDGFSEEDIRLEQSIDSCYALLNISTTPPSAPNHVRQSLKSLCLENISL